MEPLIYTTKGNVPLTTLDYEHGFEDHQQLSVSLTLDDGKVVPIFDKDGYMVFFERYYDKATKELVKENRHIYRFKGLPVGLDTGQIG